MEYWIYNPQTKEGKWEELKPDCAECDDCGYAWDCECNECISCIC